MRLTMRVLLLILVLLVVVAPMSSGAPMQPSHSIAAAIEVSKVGGLGRVELRGDIAAVLQRDEGIVALLDVSAPARPKVLGRFDDGASRSLDGDLAFSSDGKWLFYARQTEQFSKDGLLVLDVSDPKNPTEALYVPAGGAFRVAHHDDGANEWVILMDAIAGMVVYRFEPTTGALVPVHVDALPALKVGGPASAGVVVHDDPILDKPLLYAATGRTGLQVFDLSDPTAPELLGAWPDLGLAEIEVNLKGKKRLVYGAAEYWFNSTNRPVVVELDATKLGAIKQRRLLSAGCKTDDSHRVQGMAMAGDDLYVANSTAGLPVFFGKNFLRFTPVVRGAQNAEAGFLGSPYVFDVEVHRGHVYSTDAATGFMTVAERSKVAGWTYNRDELPWHGSDHYKSLGC